MHIDLMGQTTHTPVWEDADAGLRMVISYEPSDEFVRLVEQTRFGSSGLRYRRLGVADTLDRGPETRFVSLIKDDALVGVYVLEHKALRAGNRDIHGVYRSLLCVAENAQGQGYGRRLVEESLAWLDRRARDSVDPVLSFGCIESSNARSLALLQSTGARELGHLHTQMVYRQWPRRKMDVVRLDADGDDRVHAVQRESDRDCGLAYSAPQDSSFFAVTNDSTIIAGAHARVVRINFDRIGQPWDFLSDHVFAHVGPARRRFNPRDFAYLKFDGVVASPGSGRVWGDLIGTLLAEHGVHMGMFVLDPISQVSERLNQAGVFGRVAKATRQQLAVIANAHGSDRDWLEQLATRPLAVGPFGH